MKKEVFSKILSDLNIALNEWTDLYEIDGIILTNGRGIYPDWRHMRFLITDSYDILIRYGSSKPYGARLTNLFNISIDGQDIMLNTADLIPDSIFYPGFRYPQVGDILRYTRGKSLLNESPIISARVCANQTNISLGMPLTLRTKGMLSFYDPLEYTSGTECMHSNPIEGVYMKFTPNELNNVKRYGGYHESIRCKDISEVVLKVVSKRFQKTYSVKEG